ncbi:hypothetical protein [Larkinella soli]|uniref:hypothetical protein n=1 Tax=Larkinella soli TaxID=1770527 RepID=UPI000FFB3A84|nr:hypothetical protein [Larkinella soli]
MVCRTDALPEFSPADRSSSEEDIKTREKRIKDLQRELYEVRRYLELNPTEGVSLHAGILLETPAEVTV